MDAAADRPGSGRRRFGGARPPGKTPSMTFRAHPNPRTVVTYLGYVNAGRRPPPVPAGLLGAAHW
ncbi:hypothetical protein C2142_01120 [Streptomyces sp. CB01881]|nr:hypothetical protein C2142_01120 [Streptomyces sp. CB01881]